MFFTLPLLPILGVYMLAALLPAIILLGYVYQHDTIEKEPPGLLLKLLLGGVLSALAATVLEGVAQSILDALVNPSSPVYTVLLAFLVVAVVEEGMKYFFLKWWTWNHSAFNYRFDGIVYAVFVSLGFAAYENIQYVLHYGLSVALPRALLAIPGHAAFAVYMGLFYGRARLLENDGRTRAAHGTLLWGYLVAVFLHGFYDTCAMTGGIPAVLVFILFVGLVDWRVFCVLKRESAADMPV